MFRLLKRGNRVLLGWSFRRPRVVMATTAVAVLAAAVAASALPRAFLPPFNEGTFTINIAFNPGNFRLPNPPGSPPSPSG